MIGALVSLLSLEVTNRLVAIGLVATTLSVADASNTTPVIIATTAPHGLIRDAHGVVSGVIGNDGANGTWVLTPTDDTHLSLTNFTGQGAPVNSAGTGSYISGGTIQIAFPDGTIRLGRRNVAMQMVVATPRIVFVPIGSPVWDFQPYGGVIPTGTIPSMLSAQTAEQQTMKLSRQLATERQKFEVHVYGCANPPDPDFGDIDATQALYQTLYGVMFDMITPDRATVISGRWSSQEESSASFDTRGQHWIGVVQISQPVTDNPYSILPVAPTFIPTSTDATLFVNLVDAASSDQTVIVLPEVQP